MLVVPFFTIPFNKMPDYFSFSTSILIIILFFNGCSKMAMAVPGGGFATGVIDLGGLLIRQVSTFNRIWVSSEGGPDNLGATFYEPTSIPEGFFALGSYVKSNNDVKLSRFVVVAKDVTNDTTKPILKPPIDYTLVWSSNYSKGPNTGSGHIWLPVPPIGYNSVGYVVTNTSEKPLPEKVRCVRTDYTDVADFDTLVWGSGDGFNVYGSRPHHDRAIATGMFVAQNGGSGSSTQILASLKNLNDELNSMPSLDQIRSLVQTYSPVIYFHPNEKYLPSGVQWFFSNGALLYQKGNESNPSRISPIGANLPQGGWDDGTYWLDLPTDRSAKETVSKGSLENSGVYLHVKPMNGETFTDIAIWVFYPYNGGGTLKLKFLNIGLGRIGEHVGDWEHVTLRINNFNSELSSVFFSQHGKGQWVDASQLEYYADKKPIVYSSLHGHAAYPHAGLVLLGGIKGIGMREDCAKGNMMDTGVNYVIVSAEYLGSEEIVEPPWLNYARRWGPKIDYDLDNEFRKVEKFLPGKLKNLFRKIVRAIPPEAFGEDGPTGPKMKNSWTGDE